MNTLFAFLENFNVSNLIKIYDESGNLIFNGQMGDVPQKITNMTSVIRGTAIWEDGYLKVNVKKY